MKGISPIVAAVLLIAITMTMAAALAYWSQGFVGSRLPSTNTSAGQCDLAQFEFLSCKYNSTAQSITFVLNNIRTVPLSDLAAFIQFSDGAVSDGIALNGTLGTGAEAIKGYTISGGIPSNFSLVTIKTNCAELIKTHTCK